MRQAAIRAFRTARLAPSTLRSSRTSSHPLSHVLGIRQSSSRPTTTTAPGPSTSPPAPPSRSMYYRRFSVALVSGLVGYGAWFTYKGGLDNSPAALVSDASQTRGLSTTPSYALPTSTQAGGEVSRKALIVGADTLYTGEIPGNEPLSKDTDESGRKVLEMLTPEQATQKLRRNEESYLVGRGQGVVRYDVVQIPSNDPIEDDHSEKIIELPATEHAAAAQNATSDWMFWGVFDGHS